MMRRTPGPTAATGLAILLLLVSLSGCAVSTTDTVATLPAPTTSSKSSTKVTTDLPTTVAVLPFTNKTDSEFAYKVVRQTMYNHFASTNYRWLHWQDVDTRLRLAGLDSPEMIMAKTAAELAQILGVDGLIFGNITHYNKTFAGIYAQVAVGVELTFTRTDGSTIWEVKDVQRSHAGGISTSPVGLILNALVSAKHIYGDVNLYRAADELGRDLAKDMPTPETLGQRAKPNIITVVHSGVGQYLKYGDILEVAMEGSPGMTAAASIEGIGLIELEEVSPGQYSGKLAISKSQNASDLVVTGRLQDDFGQTSSWISPYGLLNIDNTPPGPVNGLVITSVDGGVKADWESPDSDDDIAGYEVSLRTSETGDILSTQTTTDTAYTVMGLTNYEPAYLSVSAIDMAGNVGMAKPLQVVAAPDNRFASARVLKSFPASISGVNKLTLANSPYYLRSNSIVAGDGVLFVAPGVEIIVSPGAKLSVIGELHVFGETSGVNVTGTGTFDEFLVLQGLLPVSITGMVVTGAGIPIQIKAGSAVIQQSIFEDCAFNCLTIDGTAKPIIENSTISGAKASGVVVSGQAQPNFKGNAFLKNDPFHLQNSSTYQINAEGNSWQPEASTITVLGDVIF